MKESESVNCSVYVSVCVCVCVFLVMSNSATPWSVTHQAPSVHGILQARILQWVAISFFRGCSRPRDWTCISYVSCISRQVLYPESPASQWILYHPASQWILYHLSHQESPTRLRYSLPIWKLNGKEIKQWRKLKLLKSHHEEEAVTNILVSIYPDIPLSLFVLFLAFA